jgi:hypothetical protein
MRKDGKVHRYWRLVRNVRVRRPVGSGPDVGADRVTLADGRPLLVSGLPRSTDIFRVVGAADVSRAGNVWSFAVKKACPDPAVDACALCCDGRGLQPRTHLPDGQFPHACHAQIARRANLSHMFALAPSGKSRRCSRASRLDEEGRFGRSSRYVGRGCGGRGWHMRRTWPEADGEVVWSWRSEAGAKLAMMLRITPMTVATKQRSPGRARYKP